MVLMPILAYLLWAVNYATINFYLSKETIERRGYTGTYQYFTQKPSIKSFFEKKKINLSPKIFIAVHFTLFFVCHLMAMLCYHNFWFNTVVVTLFANIGVWNGAVYYMEYFSKKYEKQLIELEKMQKDTTSQ